MASEHPAYVILKYCYMHYMIIAQLIIIRAYRDGLFHLPWDIVYKPFDSSKMYICSIKPTAVLFVIHLVIYFRCNHCIFCHSFRVLINIHLYQWNRSSTTYPKVIWVFHYEYINYLSPSLDRVFCAIWNVGHTRKDVLVFSSYFVLYYIVTKVSSTLAAKCFSPPALPSFDVAFGGKNVADSGIW